MSLDPNLTQLTPSQAETCRRLYDIPVVTDVLTLLQDAGGSLVVSELEVVAVSDVSHWAAERFHRVMKNLSQENLVTVIWDPGLRQFTYRITPLGQLVRLLNMTSITIEASQ